MASERSVGLSWFQKMEVRNRLCTLTLSNSDETSILKTTVRWNREEQSTTTVITKYGRSRKEKCTILVWRTEEMENGRWSGNDYLLDRFSFISCDAPLSLFSPRVTQNEEKPTTIDTWMSCKMDILLGK